MNIRRHRSTPLALTDSVLQEWFSPMLQSLDKVRFQAASYTTLPIATFILSGCLRQLLAITSLREYIQTLFHRETMQTHAPIARSTWADALSSPVRRDILRAALEKLVLYARQALPDRLMHIEAIRGREVIAIDATYQTESAHYGARYPGLGGRDNQKGHMLLSHFDVRRGIAVAMTIETESFGEMRVLKREEGNVSNWLRLRGAIHLVDRAFIDGSFWDQRYQLYQSTVITRMKVSLSYVELTDKTINSAEASQGVLYDRTIQLKCAKAQWRLVGFKAHDGIAYEYLTNDLDLAPSVVAFLYQRRWDKEKYYDSFKNDLCGAKAWGKSPVAIEQQALMGIVTTVLTRLFLQRRQLDLGLLSPDDTQRHKHQKKKYEYDEMGIGSLLRSQWTSLSKVTRQVWRFLKNCFAQIHGLALYRRQLAPLLRGYI